VGHSGFKKEFWMNHEVHKIAMQGLFDNVEYEKIDVSSGLTAQNMVSNFQIISKWMDGEFTDDLHKLESFIFFFLTRIVLINLSVEQTEVPMVFEVINDRGVKLKPYEILKGKLLGQIDKDELISLNLNEIWENQVKKLNEFAEDEIDDFFIYFLKAKLADSRGTAQKFDKDYHRVMFEDEYNKTLQLKHNPKGVKKFLLNDFVYFTNLYYKTLHYYHYFDESQPYVSYNNLTDMNTQFLLILSACSLNDPEEDLKIKEISKHLDKTFCLLQLQRSYSSNTFATEIYKISSEIRNNQLSDVEKTFTKSLIQQLSDFRSVNVDSVLSYGYFKDTGIELEKRFKRYFFARIEKFIADNTNMNMKHSLYDLIQNTGWKNGFHIEHILSYNIENKELFNDDDDLFERERNRLGGLLLLKGSDNISINNESYKKKLKSYANTLYWNETLREDTYKSKLDFRRMINAYNLNFRPIDEFGPDELEERHKLLFDIIKIIWN